LSDLRFRKYLISACKIVDTTLDGIFSPSFAYANHNPLTPPKVECSKPDLLLYK